MAIRKEVKTLVSIDPIGVKNIRTLRMELNADGEVKLTCVSLLESEFAGTLSWKEIVRILLQNNCLIRGSIGSGLVKIKREPGQVVITFPISEKSGVDCYITIEDFRKAIVMLSE